jgi:transcriptional regulator with XRE-family HTH domain
MAMLRELREAAGLTDTELAAKVGVPAGTVRGWEGGGAAPDARDVGLLALALGVTPKEVRAALLPPGQAEGGEVQ